MIMNVVFICMESTIRPDMAVPLLTTWDVESAYSTPLWLLRQEHPDVIEPYYGFMDSSPSGW